MAVSNREYATFITLFCEKFERGLNHANKESGDRAAFAFLIVRDAEDINGHVDIASNMSTDSVIDVLEEALRTARLKKNNPRR